MRLQEVDETTNKQHELQQAASPLGSPCKEAATEADARVLMVKRDRCGCKLRFYSTLKLYSQICQTSRAYG